MIRRVILLCCLLAVLLYAKTTKATESEIEQEVESFEDYDCRLLENGTWEIVMSYVNEELVIIPESIEGRPVSIIGKHSFSESDMIRWLVIPKTIRKIDDGAFYLCSSLEYISLVDGIEIIDDYAFSNCYSLKIVLLPSSVQEVGDYAFAQCHSLEVIMAQEPLRSIGDNCLFDCPLLSIVVLPIESR